MQSTRGIATASKNTIQGTKEKKKDLRVVLFGIIGVFNTLFDLVLYVIFNNLTGSIIIANIIATTAAIIGSYILNSRYTFKFKKWTPKSFVLFVVVTIFGLWVMQTGIIYALTPIINHLLKNTWPPANSFGHIVKTVLPKLIATGVTFIWNFMWYNKVIFKNDTNSEEEAIRAAEL